MPQASSNAMSLRVSPVSVFDGTMAAAAYTVLPVNANGLTYDKRTVQSQRIRDDYGVHQIIEVGAGAGGRLPFELDLLNFDLMWEALFGSSFAAGVLVNGILEKYLDIEVVQTDLTAKFLHFASMRPGQVTLNFQPEAIVTGDMTFFGHSMAQAAATASTSIVPEQDSAAAPIVNSTTDVAAVEIGGAALTSKIMRLSLTFNHNLANRPAIGEKYSVGVRRGFFQVTGSLELYDDDAARTGPVADFISHAKASLMVPLEDANGHTFEILIPRISYTGGTPESPGVNQDNRIVLPFEAEYASPGMAQITSTAPI